MALIPSKSEILKTIKRLELDLQGKVVLTEAATGPYMVTALIASLSGAEKVFAFTKSTKYGSAEFVFSQYKPLMEEWGIKNIELIDQLAPTVISQCDIITNSGHLRPLDQSILRHMKPNSVISLMYEKWEFRDEDIDLDYCKKNNIPIAVLNERHKDVDVFNYLGDMAMKLIFDANLCLYNNKFILLCNNQFGPFIAKTLSKVCQLGVIAPSSDKALYEGHSIDWLSDFPEIKISDEYRDAKAVLFTAYPFDKSWIGDSGAPITLDELIRQINDPLILRYAGDMDTQSAIKLNVPYYPLDVKSGHMGILPSEIGPDPIMRLQAGGLKAAECVLAGQLDLHSQNLADTFFNS